MSEKVCPHHGHHHHRWHRIIQGILACLASFIILVLLIILIIWLVLRPTKPRFYLQDATVYTFNTTGGPPNLLNTNIQVTIASRNPNDRIGIYYDRLHVYASYKFQQITPATAVTPIYQGHHDVLLWSPFLCGVDVPVAPILTGPLQQDLKDGLLLLYVKLDGRIRWKVGSWTSGRYHLFVTCPALITFRPTWGDGADDGYSPVVRTVQRVAACSVDV